MYYLFRLIQGKRKITGPKEQRLVLVRARNEDARARLLQQDNNNRIFCCSSQHLSDATHDLFAIHTGPGVIKTLRSGPVCNDLLFADLLISYFYFVNKI